RSVTIIGAGQSALEAAALLQEIGAQVRVIVRGPEVYWNAWRNGRRPLAQRIAYPESGLGFGWDTIAISEMPQTYRRLFPMEKRHRHVAKSWGPSGAYWLRRRVEGQIEILVNHHVREAKAEQGRIRLEIQGPDRTGSDGTKSLATDHVIAATGYKVDLDRL